jgi:hypothetical protein
MLNIATSSIVFLTLSFAFIAEAANCPLVNIAGTYSFDLRTEKASSWYGIDGNYGCRKTGRTESNGIQINPDGTMVGGTVVLSPGGRKSEILGGRIEPDNKPVQWEASAGDIEMKGTWVKGQLSGEFVQRFIEQGKEVECRGKVSGFKRGK